MIERFVERVGVDSEGRITAISWDGGHVGAEEASHQIQQRVVDYLVKMTDGSPRRVSVVYGPRGPSLFASWDGGPVNRLPELPPI